MANVRKSNANVAPRTSKVELRSDGSKRRICFVTGTRAEFGLMRSTLLALRGHPLIDLQIVATGMHLSQAHGRTINSIRADGWQVDATVSWPFSPSRSKAGPTAAPRASTDTAVNKGVRYPSYGRETDTAGQAIQNKGVRYPYFGGNHPFRGGEAGTARQTGRAMAGLAAALDRLNSDIVLVVGDRVEAFAAAAAGHISGRIVAHVHGGDRALGQVDDSLRHSITKLAHLHFPATVASRQRILKLGEDPWRVHRVGSPGIDGIAIQAAPSEKAGRFALVVLHPTDTDESAEQKRAELVLTCVRRIGFDRIVIVYPNSDPGSAGIIRCWESVGSNAIVFRDVPRPRFLGLMRDAAVLIGNSSSGIIEAASFGTPVVDIGPRQMGRERSSNVANVPFVKSRIDHVLQQVWNGGKPIRYPPKNVYGGDGAGQRIADVLANVQIDEKLSRKLIAY